MLPISNWELVLVLATFPQWQHLQVFESELELECGIGDLRILRGTLLFVSRFSTLSSQGSPKTQLYALGELGVRQLGIGIGFGNISTLATFTRVEVGEWSWRFENLMRKILILPPDL